MTERTNDGGAGKYAGHTEGPWVHENRDGDHPLNNRDGWGTLGLWSKDSDVLIFGSGIGWELPYDPPENPADIALIEDAWMLPMLLAQRDALVDALEEVMSWISNWEPSFIHDESGEWDETQARIEAALAIAKEQQ